MAWLNTFLFLAAATSAGLVSGIPTSVQYEPGKLDVFELDMYLSKGLTAKVIAKAKQPVVYFDGTTSTENFHTLPDGAAVFEDESATNPGGWVYVSNSEADFNNGGVGAIKFDVNGNVINYRMLLTGTKRNCNGGKTDWNAWISCEEDLGRRGKVWQVDPFGVREPVTISLGSQGGTWEAFAHDSRDPRKLYAFLTEDMEDGALPRMTIENPDYTNPWNILLDSAPVDYLFLEPDSIFERTSGTFKWIPDEAEAKANAEEYYPNTEGMKLDGHVLRIVSKKFSGFFQLDLDNGTYTFERAGMVGGPDQSITVVQDDGSKLIYFTEEAPLMLGLLGQQVGIWTRNEAGVYTPIIFGDWYSHETTGVAFSPNGMHMYFAYQLDGYVFDVTRSDGLSFFVVTPEPSEDSSEELSFLAWMEAGLNDIRDWLSISLKGDVPF